MNEINSLTIIIFRVNHEDWLKRDLKIFSTFILVLVSKLDTIWALLGQFIEPTKYMAATKPVLSEEVQNQILFSSFQLPIVIAMQPSDLMQFLSKYLLNYQGGVILTLSTSLWPSASILPPPTGTQLQYTITIPY